MTKDEARRVILLGDPNEMSDYEGLEEKHNSWEFTFGIEDGKPVAWGIEWVGTVTSTYGYVDGAEFEPADEFIKQRWADRGEDAVAEEYASEKEVEAWRALGFPVDEVKAEALGF